MRNDRREQLSKYIHYIYTHTHIHMNHTYNISKTYIHHQPTIQTNKHMNKQLEREHTINSTEKKK